MSPADEVMREHNLDVRMDVERQELGKAIREKNYDRAISIAQYIIDQIWQERIRERENKQ